MKVTIDGKRYNTEHCEILGEYSHYSSNGNYSGTTSLLRAGNGVLLVWLNTNGQDGYLRDDLRAWETEPNYPYDDNIDSYSLTPEQEIRCAELGLIEIVEK